MSAWTLLSSVFGRSRRVPRTGFKQLTSKIGPRTFYKGKGCTPIGRHTRKGGYMVQEWKLPEFIVPDLKGFKLKPFVAYDSTPPK